MRRLWIASLVLVLGACLEKEKGGKPADSWTPSWDSSNAPRLLSDFRYEGPESLFAVFKKMESADSAVRAAHAPAPSQKPTDTLRVHHLFDTGFVFPPRSEASMPYAYDNFYRDDTLFRKAYGNGLFEQEHPCIESWVLSDPFLHPARWVRSGLKQEEILASLGAPFLRHPFQLRYRWHADDGNDSEARHESMRFYFENDSLYAVLLQRSKPCF